MPATIQVRGARQLSRALKRAGIQVADMKAANERVANVVKDAAQPITPTRTGALAGSIRSAKAQSQAVVRAGGGRVKYGRYVHYGTSRMAARPFLTTALGQSQPEVLDTYWRELQQLMDQVAAASPGTGP